MAVGEQPLDVRPVGLRAARTAGTARTARPCPGPRPSPGRASAACRRPAARCRRRTAPGRCPRCAGRTAPPCWRAKARLNSDMYAVPTCGSPVGRRRDPDPHRPAVRRLSHGPRPGWSGCRPARSSRSTSSPTASGPTPAGVPVRITSPGSSVIAWLTCDTSSSTPRIICEVRPACSSSPLTVVVHGEVGRVEVGGDPRAERAEGVEALGPAPLLLGALQVAGRDVVGAGEAEHDVLDPLRRHLAAQPGDDDGQLALVVDLARRCRRGTGSASPGPITEVDGLRKTIGGSAGRPRRPSPARARRSCARSPTTLLGSTGASSRTSASGQRVADDLERRERVPLDPPDGQAARRRRSAASPSTTPNAAPSPVVNLAIRTRRGYPARREPARRVAA